MSQTVQSSSTAQRPMVIATLVGAAIAFLGSFLDWGKLEFQGESDTVAGLDADGVFTLILALIAAGLVVAGMVTGRAVIGAIATVPGLVVLAFGILNVVDTDRLIRAGLEAESDGAPAEKIDEAVEMLSKMADTSAGIGLWAVLLGGVVMAVCPVILGLTNRGRR